MSKNTVNDKHGEPIQEGDHVYTKVLGGQHEGDVSKIVTGNNAAKTPGVKTPTKVLFTDHKGQDVAHNAEVLEHREGSPQEYESSREIGG
ncbi:hypothetical protein PG996_010841 [Apiospora saccharicola]|uniref:Hypervirulence associated protein TUDOR domain-containing protein n=1 Tax=Apiospora saccharicola TaxID=335842 RepID=A0ABR1UPS9_9PEZI